MYPTQRFIRGIFKGDNLTCYQEREKIIRDVDDDVISCAEAGFFNGWNEAGISYEEEEIEEAEVEKEE